MRLCHIDGPNSNRRGVHSQLCIMHQNRKFHPISISQILSNVFLTHCAAHQSRTRRRLRAAAKVSPLLQPRRQQPRMLSYSKNAISSFLCAYFTSSHQVSNVIEGGSNCVASKAVRNLTRPTCCQTIKSSRQMRRRGPSPMPGTCSRPRPPLLGDGAKWEFLAVESAPRDLLLRI